MLTAVGSGGTQVPTQKCPNGEILSDLNIMANSKRIFGLSGTCSGGSKLQDVGGWDYTKNKSHTIKGPITRFQTKADANGMYQFGSYGNQTGAPWSDQTCPSGSALMGYNVTWGDDPTDPSGGKGIHQFQPICGPIPQKQVKQKN